MKRLLFILVFSALLHALNAQTKALTENGREVQLFDNGTWKYTQDSTKETPESADSITTNPHLFAKTAGATFLVKSNNFNVGVFINPAKWTFSPHKDNEVVPEYEFSLKSGKGFAMMITETTPIDLESLKQIALINAQKAALDARIISAEYRTVDRKKVLCLQMKGTIKSIRFVYLGYYYSNENGTLQLVSMATQNEFGETRKELEDLLNGLVVINK